MSRTLIVLVLAGVALAGSACAVVPVAPPGPAMYAPAPMVVAAPPPVVVVRPWYRRHWHW